MIQFPTPTHAPPSSPAPKPMPKPTILPLRGEPSRCLECGGRGLVVSSRPEALSAEVDYCSCAAGIQLLEEAAEDAAMRDAWAGAIADFAEGKV